MRTKLSTIIILILMSNTLSAQFKVDAGKDTAFCFNSNDSVKIGGNPTAQGGEEPYSYSWTAKYPGLAKDILTDTAAANPVIIDLSMGDITLRLTVKDHTGVEEYDSITINSVAILSTLVYYAPIINKGDTIVLPHNEFVYGIEPVTYYWTPDYNISNTTISYPKAWPDSSTTYLVYMIDAIGCQSRKEDIQVTVNHSLNILNSSENETESWVMPNPINGNSKIYIKTDHFKELQIKILNVNGQMIFSDHFSTTYYEIGNKIISSGMYIYLISDDNLIITSGQFIKN
jgi:hypothetical protein